MWKKLKAWRRKQFPTKNERFDDGKAFAAEELRRHGVEYGVAVIQSTVTSYSDAFDRGMLHQAREARSFFNGGWKTADQIINGAPKHVAIDVITRKTGNDNPYFKEGMDARLLKEKWT